MNNIYRNISGFASSVKRMSKLLSVICLLLVSGKAWATHYLRGGNDNYNNWTTLAFTNSEAPYVFTCSVGSGNTFVGIGESETAGSFTDIPEDAIINYDSEYFYQVKRKEWNSRYELQIDSKYEQTICVIFDGVKTYTVGVPSWTLCGEFTDWTPANAPEFTGSGSTLSLQIYLPYQADYTGGTKDHGFKIVSTVGDVNTWYGNTGKITASVSDWTFTNESGDNYNCGIVTGWSGYYTFTFDTSTKQLSVTYPAAVKSTPIARWGDEPAYGGSSPIKDIVASVYIASQGCGGTGHEGSAQTVDEIKVRYWVKDNPSVIGTKTEDGSASYDINAAHSINIPFDDDILLNCVTESTIVMEVAAHNANGWSPYSDQMEFAYTANHEFVTNNISGKTFTQCDGKHQFLLKDMVRPVPDSWSATLGGYDATADFTLTDDGYMVWNPSGKTADSYTYTFTFDKTVGAVVYPIVNPTLSFTYSATSIAKDITELTASSSSVYPWDEVTLTATYPSDKDFTALKWTVDKASGYNLVSSAMGETSATATFKGSTLFGSTIYNIKVQGTNSDCVTTTGQSVAVTVSADTEPCETATQIKIGANPVLEEGPRVTLSGYLKYRGNGSNVCIDDYTTYGFCYSTTQSKIDAATPDFNDAAVLHKEKTGAALTENNRNWTYTISDGLSEGTYYYKPYIMRADGTKVFGSVTGSFTIGSSEKCVHPVGDPINYYIDDDYDDNDPCALKFKTLADAIANLKTHTGSDDDDWWDATNENNMLKVNVIFNVYPGTYGDSKSSTIDLSEINKFNASITPTKRLTIKGTDATNKPVLYGLYMAKSRWITVENVRVERVTTGSNLTQSSILVGFNEETNNLAVGKMSNAGLEFVKCDIEVDGFTCIHANGVDGFYMSGCNLIADRTETITDNDRNWGASIKFMNSKNVRLLRNNFRGSHANNIFFQNSRETLIMNNVFWNDNKVTYNSETNNPSFIRLVNFQANDDAHKLTKIGIYYNTFYLAHSGASGESDKKVDFMAFSGTAQGGISSADRYDVAHIDFKYNNCYSYSTLNSGNNGSQFYSIDVSGTFTDNNFWSAKSGATSSFVFGSSTQNVNMSLSGGMICSTAPNDPDGLVIRGNSLNLGSKITSDASGLGAENISDDRLRDEIRPASGSGWTYGAYQQTTGEDVDVIYWLGTQNTTWDNRNNWYKLVNGEYQLVTCVDYLTDNLKVIIPEQTGSTKRYPIIPEWSDPAGRNEGVYTKTTNQFAKTIDIQYGASVMGVENLKEGASTYRYFEGITHLEADRKEWLMVGTVICPFKKYEDAVAGTDTTSRLVVSGDFYRDHLPHIYMQQFGYTGTAINWDAPFTALDESVPYDRCFTIFCADQYGPKKRTAYMYYGDASKGTEPIKYEFKGRFAAEKLTGKPSYSFTSGQNYFVNNYYPANVLAKAFSSVDGLTVKAYDPVKCGWNDVTLGSTTDFEIRPQSGVFVMASKDVNNMTLKDTDFSTNSTKYKSAGADQGLILSAVATATGKGSNIGVWQYYKNITKAENASDADVCELYMPYEGINLSTLSFADADTTIALGIHNKLNIPMSIKFELVESSMLSEIYLEDRSVEPVVRYDLLAGEKPYFANLESGYTEGRFYLVLGDGSESGHDIPTPAKAEDAENFGIDVFVNDNVLTVSVSSGATISNITLFDMAGKACNVPVNGTNMSQSRLNVAAGVYMVKVVTDKGTETKKVVVK